LAVYRFQILTENYNADWDLDYFAISDYSGSDSSEGELSHDEVDHYESSSTPDERSQDEADSAKSTASQYELSPDEASFAESPSSQESDSEGLSDQEGDLSQGPLMTQADAWNQLKSHLVPLLSNLIINMHLCFDPAHILKDPASNLQLILEIQSQLDHTLRQIKRAINIICPEKDGDSSESYKHLQKFGHSRLIPLNTALRDDLWSKTSELIELCCRSIKGMGLSHPYVRHGGCYWKRNSKRTSAVLAVIDSATLYLKQSDFDLVQRDWPKPISAMDGMLEECMQWIHETTLTRRMKPFIQLALLLLPIIKLCRLFFNRLSKYGQKSLPFCISMHYDQLESIKSLPHKVAGCLEKFLVRLKTPLRDGDGSPEIYLSISAKSLKASFELPLIYISHYFVILISNTVNLPEQNSFKTWYATWCNTFNLAMDNLKNTICC
jgi:hypothetical protein